MIDKDKVINVWLDESNEVGILEEQNDKLGSVFLPIELSDNRKYYRNDDALWFPNYIGARRKIQHMIEGGLTKRSIGVLNIHQ